MRQAPSLLRELGLTADIWGKEAGVQEQHRPVGIPVYYAITHRIHAISITPSPAAQMNKVNGAAHRPTLPYLCCLLIPQPYPRSLRPDSQLPFRKEKSSSTNPDQDIPSVWLMRLTDVALLGRFCFETLAMRLEGL